MPKTKSVIGVGELVVDHVYEKATQDRLIYRGTRSGGPLWNVICHLNRCDWKATALGICGDDHLGRYCQSILAEAGLDVELVRTVSNRVTASVHQILERNDLWGATSPRINYSSRCLVCTNPTAKNRVASMNGRLGINHSWPGWESALLFCCDKLSTGRRELAQEVKASNIQTVIDLRRIGYLRYWPIARILDHLSAFSNIIISEDVAYSILRRSGFSTHLELARALEPRFVFVVKPGKGIDGFYCERRTLAEEIPFPYELGMPGSGAYQDKLIATIIDCLPSQRLVSSPEKSVTSSHDWRELLARIGGQLAHIPHSSEGSWPMSGYLPSIRVTDPVLRPLQGMSIDEIREQMIGKDVCPLCGATTRDTEILQLLSHPTVQSQVTRSVQPSLFQPTNYERAGLKRAYSNRQISTGGYNVGILLRRVLFVAENTKAINQCRKVLESKGTAYTVGTGGSFVAATFVAQVLATHSQVFAQAIRPLDYLRLAKPTDFVLIFSYSGSTSDYVEVILHARRLGAGKILLVTGVNRPLLGRTIRGEDSIISYATESHREANRERGFISIAGTVFPCLLWVLSTRSPTDSIRLATELSHLDYCPLSENALRGLADTISGVGALDVFGSGYAWPSMLDIESKFVESGLARVELNESKDFSHGRFVRGFSTKPVAGRLVMSVGQINSYEAKLLDILRSRGESPVVHLGVERESIEGGLELLISTQHIIHRLGKLMGRDISRPRSIPRDGLELYRWDWTSNEDIKPTEMLPIIESQTHK